MKQRSIGLNGPKVSALGYGAMSFSNFYGPATDEGSMAILDACLENGITHVDTANVYGMGRSETVIGTWIKRRGGENPFTIATKVGITDDPDQRLNNDPTHMRESLEASLKRLDVEAVDLYYVHRRDTRFEIEEVTQTMAQFVKEGKVKAIGFSEIAPSSLRRAHAVHPIAAVQSEYSLATRSPEMGLVQTCAELGTTLIAFSPVGRAFLTDRPHNLEAVQDMPFLKTNPRFMEPNISRNLEMNAKFRALAADKGVATASLAIAWVLHQGEHILPIPGTRHAEHLQELVAGAQISLTQQDVADIERVLPIGWTHGDRYSEAQWKGPERYC
ncbi:MAG: aldo/keto reductase [Pseudomonadota bacterium]